MPSPPTSRRILTQAGSLGSSSRLVGNAYEVRFSSSVVTLTQPGAEAPGLLSMPDYDPGLGWQTMSAFHDQRQRAFVRPVTASGIFALASPLWLQVYLPLVLR